MAKTIKQTAKPVKAKPNLKAVPAKPAPAIEQPAEDKGWHERHKDLDGLSVAKLAALCKEAEEIESVAKKIASAKAERVRYIKEIALPTAMDAAGMQTCVVKDIGRIQITGEIQCAIRAEKKEEVYQWLRDHGKGSLISPFIQPSTLKASIKAMIREGEEVPDDLFHIHKFSRASITKV